MNKTNLGAEGLGRSCLFFDASVSNLILPLFQCSVLVQHLVEGVVKLARDRVDLQLLPDDLVLQLVDPERDGILWIEGETIFVLQHIFCIASHYHWYLWCSLLMFISAYSDLESDCFRRMFNCLIWSCTIMILSKFILVSKNCFDQFMLVWR